MDLLGIQLSADDIVAKTVTIRQATLRESAHICEPNFTQIHRDDVARLFTLYDQSFFEGWLERSLEKKSGRPLSFRLSSTMTRAGGKTIRTQHRELRNRRG